MKHIAKLITILLLSIMTAFSAKVYADDNNTGNGNNDAPKHIVRKSTAKLSHKTSGNRMPSNIKIEFLYCEDGIEFLASPYYSILDVTIEDMDALPILSTTVTVDNPTIESVFDEGIYTVTCVNEQGQTFVGYFEI